MTETQEISEDGGAVAAQEESPLNEKSWAKLVGIVLGLSAVVGLMLLAFLTPQYHSGAEDLPVGVAGPEAATAKLTQALGEKQPGAFKVTSYANPDDIKEAIRHREEIGGISVSPEGMTIYTAAGAGQPYKQVLTGIGGGMQAQGQKVTYEELAPTTDKDPNAMGLSVLALPLAFGGMISAGVLSNAMKHHRGLRVLGSLCFSAVAGLLVAAILKYGFGTFDANYLELAGIIGLGIAGTSMFVLGLESFFGLAGLGIGAVLTLFVSNPLSGIATGWQWLPQPWGEIGQYLPIGAAGNAIRSVAFFGGYAVAHSVWTQIAWVLVGAGLVGLRALKMRGKEGKAQLKTPSEVTSQAEAN